MSINHIEQNGRLPPLSNRLSLDSRARNVSDRQKAICRKYIWGTCTKDAHCKFRHELDIDEMKKILKFCHDYQNKQGCTRADCTYLHASKEEQTLFINDGQLPHVLAERYAAITDMQSGNITSFEGVPQMVKYVTAPPPPPPLPPAPMMGPAVGPEAALPPPPPPGQPMPIFSSVQQLPPPPPPPTTIHNAQATPIFTGPPPTNTDFPMNRPPPAAAVLPMFDFDANRPRPPYAVCHMPYAGQSKNGPVKRRFDSCEVLKDMPMPIFSSVQQLPPPPQPTIIHNAQATPIFTGPPPTNTDFPMNRPPPAAAVLPMFDFDANRPRPPYAVCHMPYAGQSKNGPVKRRYDSCEAGPSKVRKTETPKDTDSPCENCVERELRIDIYKQQMCKLICEELVIKKKFEDYERSKELLRSLVTPEVYRILDEYIEGGPPDIQDFLAPYSQAQFSSSTLPKELAIQILEYAFNSRSDVDSALSPSFRFDDNILNSRSSLTRRPNYVNNSDIAQAMLDVLRNSNTTPNRSHMIESHTAEALNEPSRSNSSSAHNGFNRFTNGQKAESSSQASVLIANQFSAASGPRHTHHTPHTSSRTYQGMGVAGPSGMTASSSRIVPPSHTYATYNPSIPPPGNRTFYQQQYGPAPTNAVNPNISYNNPVRGDQMPVRPSTSSVPPQNLNPYMMGRYPYPHQYYPPYQ